MTDDAGQPRSFRRRGLGRGLEALLSSEPEGGGDGSPLVSVDPRDRRARTRSSPAGRSTRRHSRRSVTRSVCTACFIRSSSSATATRSASSPVSGACAPHSSPGWRASPRSSDQQPSRAATSLEMALTENLLRTDLNPMEEAAAYARLADAFGLTHEAIALRLGRSRSGITNAIRLLNLPAPVQEAVAADRLTAGHARALLALPNAVDQETMAAAVIADGLSVRETERAIQDLLTAERRTRAAQAGGAGRGAAGAGRRRVAPRPRARPRSAGPPAAPQGWRRQDRHRLGRRRGPGRAVPEAGRPATLTPRRGLRDQPIGRSAAPVRRASAASASKLARKASMYFGRSAGL